jgi:acyl carrier protein
MEYTAKDRIPLFSSLSAGQGVVATWCALLNGAVLCPFPIAVNGTTGLRAWMIDQGITAYSSSASIFRQFMKTLDGNDIKFPLVRAVRLASESATSSDFALFQRHFAEHCSFVHTLSSSETGNISVSRLSRNDKVPEGRLAIGTLANGIEVLLLDERNQPVMPGEIGDIVVRGRYLAAGYWRQPAVTAERFSGDIGGVRQFRTGDLGRINSEGRLEYVGRADSRVKIRGNRVELTEVEDALQRLPAVERAVVVSIEKANQEHWLTGYVVAGDGRWSEKGLRMALRDLLPDHMIPSAMVLLDRFPVTSSGKIDREKLRQLSPLLSQQSISNRSAQGTSGDPRTKIQQTLLGLWCDVLKRRDIGCDDDFFLLGGDSLSAVDLLHRIEAELQYKLPITILAEAPTVRQLEVRLQKSTRGAIDDMIGIHTGGGRRPLFAFGGRYGHVLRLLPALRSLGPDQPCYGLQPPGMDWTAAGCATLQQMAAHYIGKVQQVQPRGPYRLLGSSFGGLVVFEIALQLQKMG